MEWLKKIRNKEPETRKGIALALALIITVVFAVPWFYYKYVAEKPPISMETIGSPFASVAGVFSKPLGKMIKEGKDKIFNSVSNLFLGEDEYEKK